MTDHPARRWPFARWAGFILVAIPRAPPVTDYEALPGKLAIPAGSNCEKITYRRDPRRHLAMPGTASSRRRAHSPRCAVRAPRWHPREIEAYRTFGETVNTCAYPSRTIVRLNVDHRKIGVEW